MGSNGNRIAEALFSSTQQKVLGLLFSQPERRFYVSEIVRHAKKGTGAVCRELARLADAGLVTIERSRNRSHYQANRSAPVFEELAGLFAKLAPPVQATLRSPRAAYAVERSTAPPAIPRAKLAALCRKYHVRRLGLFGSAARGELAPGSDVDLLIEFEPGKAPSLWAEPEIREAFGALFGRPVDLVLSTSTGPLLGQVAPGVRLVDLRCPRVLRSVVPLARYLRRERPRALVSSMSHANLVALWAARAARTGTPVIVTEHNTMSQAALGQGRLERALWPPVLRAFYPWASHVVAVSRDAAEDFARTVGLAPERVEVIYNPVIMPGMRSLARQTPDHPWLRAGEPPVVLGIGRLTLQKDFPTLIRAFALVRRQRSVRLIILGEGGDRPALEALVAELGLGEDVALPGFRDNPLAYLSASALFVLSSAWEGLPTVLIEALAAGTRVVSTDCRSGPREILQESVAASSSRHRSASAEELNRRAARVTSRCGPAR